MDSTNRLNQQLQAARNQLLQMQRSNGTSDPLLREAMAQLALTLKDIETATADLHQQHADLHQTQQRLESERQRYQSIFAFGPDAYLVTDDQGRIQEGNRAAGLLLQIRCEHLVGQPLVRFLAEADHALVEAQLERITQVIQFQPSPQSLQPTVRPTNRPTNQPTNIFLQDQEVTVQPSRGNPFPASLAISAELNHQGQIHLYWALRDLRDRKWLETSLQESEARYRLLSEMSPLGIFRYDPAGCCTYVNERMLQLVDRPLEACLGLNWIETIYPDDRQRVVAALQAFMADAAEHLEAIHQLECRHLHSNGQMVWVWAQIAAERNAAGTITGYVGTLIDITERKQLEGNLKLSEERLRLVLDLNQIGSWDWHPTTATAHWNPYLYRLLGYQPGEVEPSYERWRERIHPDDLDEVEQHFTAALTARTDWEAEYRILLPDGSLRWVMSRGRGIYNESGLFLRMLGIAFDITARKQAESALHQRENFIGGVLGSITDVLTVLDKTWCFTFVNGKMLVQTGLKLSDLMGKNIWEVFAHMVDTEPYRLLHQAMRERISVEYEFYDQPLQKWFSDRAYPTPDGGLAIYSQDITQRKQIETALSESQARLRLAMETAEVFSWEIDIASGRSTWSDHAARVLGFPAERMPKTVAEVMAFNHPDDAMRVTQAIEAALTGDAQSFSFEQRLIHPVDQSIIWVQAQGIVEPFADGQSARLVGLSHNITERKRREANAAFLAELMVDFANLSTADEIMQVASTKIAAYFQASRCLLVEINVPADEARVIYNWFSPGLLNLVGVYHLPDFHTAAERAQLSVGRPLIIPDTAALEQTAAEGFSQLSIGALLNAPYLSEGRWKFSLCVMQAESRQWRKDEIELLQELSARIWLRLERAYVETALRLSEEQRRLALDLTHTAIWEWMLDSGEVIWSDNMFHLLGLTPGSVKLTYELWQNHVHPADLERLEAAAAMHLQNQTLYNQEYRVIHPDGTIRWLLSTGQGIYNAAGEAVRMVGITLDITERKQLELSLQASEAKLSRILDSAIVVVVSFKVWDNRDWEYEYWSAGYEDLYGFTVEEMRADKYLWLSQVLPEDRDAVILPLLDRFLIEPKSIVEYRFRRKDGVIRWICSIYVSEQISPHCWMITSANYDVTDRKNLEQELLQMNAELELRVRARTLELEQAMQAAEAASRAKSAFLANMSHELRTPLNAILGFSQLLGRDPDLTAVQQEQIGIINRSGEHLLKLINDILEMTQIESDQTSLILSNLALERLLNELAAMFRLKAEMQGIRLIIQCDDAVPRYIQMDEIRLRQVLINLLSNAIKFTSAGSVTLRVQQGDRKASRAADPPDSLLLHFAVEDTGLGIDPQEQAKLFQPFGQIQTGYTMQEGAGLGLPISQEYVRLMGGELNFTSSPGVGTTFYFQIPVVPLAFTDLAGQPLPQAIEPSADAENFSELPLAALQTMPAEWIAQMRQAVPSLDEDKIFQLLDQMPPSEALLAQTLKEWVYEFRFDKLIHLIEAIPGD